MDAFIKGLSDVMGNKIEIVDYKEHAIGEGSDTKAVAYVEIADQNKQSRFGVAMHANIITASLHSIVSAVNRLS